MAQSINITIPPGPLGVGIVSEDGNCVISSKSNQSNSPLMVDDIIISLNGIKLSNIEGGVDGWVQLFQMFGQVQRNLVVQRVVTNNSSSTNNNSSSMTNGALKDSTNHDSSPHDSSPVKKQKVMKQEKKASTNTSSKLSEMEVISLLSDDEDEEYDTLGKNKNGGTTTAAASSTRGGDKNVLDPDVLEVPVAPSWRATSDPTTSRGNLKDDNNYNNSGTKKSNDEEDDEDEELTVIATKGSNALADFPHSRENCVTHSFSGNKQAHCSNCYCYVCDKPAKDCSMWASHCSASHSDPRWRRERELAKHRARELEAAPVQPPPAAAARPLVTAPSSSQLSRSRRSADFSISKLLSEITTVHPVEMQPPSGRGFSTSLRHYQKQSLAFMVETERTHNRGGWLSDEVSKCLCF